MLLKQANEFLQGQDNGHVLTKHGGKVATDFSLI